MKKNKKKQKIFLFLNKIFLLEQYFDLIFFLLACFPFFDFGDVFFFFFFSSFFLFWVKGRGIYFFIIICFFHVFFGFSDHISSTTKRPLGPFLIKPFCAKP